MRRWGGPDRRRASAGASFPLLSPWGKVSCLPPPAFRRPASRGHKSEPSGAVRSLRGFPYFPPGSGVKLTPSPRYASSGLADDHVDFLWRIDQQKPFLRELDVAYLAAGETELEL